MADRHADLKLQMKSLKQQQQQHLIKLQHKSEADAEILDTLREYANVQFLNLEIEQQYSKVMVLM